MQPTVGSLAGSGLALQLKLKRLESPSGRDSVAGGVVPIRACSGSNGGAGWSSGGGVTQLDHQTLLTVITNVQRSSVTCRRLGQVR